MPIRSKAQWRLFEAKHPELLKKWQLEHHVNFDNLLEHVKKAKKAAKASRR